MSEYKKFMFGYIRLRDENAILKARIAELEEQLRE